VNLPQWITVIAGSLTALVWVYWAVAMIWLNTADLWADTPWWLRPVDKVAGWFYRG
jgi:hypothetical protein